MTQSKSDKPVPLSELIHDPEKMAEAAQRRQAEARRRTQKQSGFKGPLETLVNEIGDPMMAKIIKLPWWGNDFLRRRLYFLVAAAVLVWRMIDIRMLLLKKYKVCFPGIRNG